MSKKQRILERSSATSTGSSDDDLSDDDESNGRDELSESELEAGATALARSSTTKLARQNRPPGTPSTVLSRSRRTSRSLSSEQSRSAECTASEIGAEPGQTQADQARSMLRQLQLKLPQPSTPKGIPGYRTTNSAGRVVSMPSSQPTMPAATTALPSSEPSVRSSGADVPDMQRQGGCKPLPTEFPQKTTTMSSIARSDTGSRMRRKKPLRSSRGHGSFGVSQVGLSQATTNTATGATTPAVIPASQDVKLGRGKPFQTHRGNRRLHRIVNGCREMYYKSDRANKVAIGQALVTLIKQNGARFIQHIKGDEERWEEVDDSAAREKIAHTFRNKLKKLKERGIDPMVDDIPQMSDDEYSDTSVNNDEEFSKASLTRSIESIIQAQREATRLSQLERKQLATRKRRLQKQNKRDVDTAERQSTVVSKRRTIPVLNRRGDVGASTKPGAGSGSASIDDKPAVCGENRRLPSSQASSQVLRLPRDGTLQSLPLDRHDERNTASSEGMQQEAQPEPHTFQVNQEVYSNLHQHQQEQNQTRQIQLLLQLQQLRRQEEAQQAEEQQRQLEELQVQQMLIRHGADLSLQARLQLQLRLKSLRNQRAQQYHLLLADGLQGPSTAPRSATESLSHPGMETVPARQSGTAHLGDICNGLFSFCSPDRLASTLPHGVNAGAGRREDTQNGDAAALAALGLSAADRSLATATGLRERVGEQSHGMTSVADTSRLRRSDGSTVVSSTNGASDSLPFVTSQARPLDGGAASTGDLPPMSSAALLRQRLLQEQALNALLSAPPAASRPRSQDGASTRFAVPQTSIDLAGIYHRNTGAVFETGMVSGIRNSLAEADYVAPITAGSAQMANGVTDATKRAEPPSGGRPDGARYGDSCDR